MAGEAFAIDRAADSFVLSTGGTPVGTSLLNRGRQQGFVVISMLPAWSAGDAGEREGSYPAFFARGSSSISWAPCQDRLR